MKYKVAIYACLGMTLIPVFLWMGTGMHFATRWECQSTACNVAADCYVAGDSDAKKWACKESKEGAQVGKKCFDTEFEDFMEDEQAPLRGCFEFGITPSSLLDGVLPLSGAFFGLAALLFFLGRRQS